MSDSKNLDLSALIPGFDMFKQMAGQIPGMGKGASLASNPFMPKAGNWIAPSLSVEELDKRIAELQTVKLWLENNARLIEATTQALQVQKMTLSTLQEMKVNLGKVWPGMGAHSAASSHSSDTARKTSRSRSKTHFDLGTGAASKDAASSSAAASSARATNTTAAKQARKTTSPSNDTAQADSSAAMQLASQQAMQMWQGLTQQFGQIATQVMQDSQAAAEKITASQKPAANTRNRARKQSVAPATKTKSAIAVKTPTKSASKTSASRSSGNTRSRG